MVPEVHKRDLNKMATAGPSSSQEKVRESHSKVSIEEKLKLATEFKVTAVFPPIERIYRK